MDISNGPILLDEVPASVRACSSMQMLTFSTRARVPTSSANELARMSADKGESSASEAFLTGGSKAAQTDAHRSAAAASIRCGCRLCANCFICAYLFKELAQIAKRGAIAVPRHNSRRNQRTPRGRGVQT